MPIKIVVFDYVSRYSDFLAFSSLKIIESLMNVTDIANSRY